jgi:hypothetical protein
VSLGGLDLVLYHPAVYLPLEPSGVAGGLLVGPNDESAGGGPVV